MKRSTNVALTLLVPVMTAFGCGRPAPPPMNQQVAADCNQLAKPGEPEKPKCNPVTTGHGTTHGTGYGSGYRSSHGSWFGPIFGGSSYRSSSPVTSHGSTSTSHSSGSSSVSHGGFGSSGAHFSGGS